MHTHFLPVLLTSAAASLIEFIEALTVVLAVGVTCGWRSAFAGAASATLLLGALVAFLGPALLDVPAHLARLVCGTLLVLFGMRWLRKATRRAGGLIALRNENVAFARHRSRLAQPAGPGRWNKEGFAAAFQATTIEGIEVVFVVVAMAAGGRALLEPAVIGAALAFTLVVCLGALLHRPINRIPENTLKRGVGVLLMTFGTFWIGEGADFPWPGGDLAIVVMAGLYAAMSFVMAGRLGRRQTS